MLLANAGVAHHGQLACLGRYPSHEYLSEADDVEFVGDNNALSRNDIALLD